MWLTQTAHDQNFPVLGGAPARDMKTSTLTASLCTLVISLGANAFSAAPQPSCFGTASLHGAAHSPKPAPFLCVISPHRHCASQTEAARTLPSLRMPRREVLGVATGLAFLAPTVASAKGGPAGGGAGDPNDKQKIEAIAATLDDIAGRIDDSGAWKDIIAIVSKSPFEKLSMEKAFDQAAKGLPENVKRIYGGDGGEWIGIKNEAVDSVDAFAAELSFLASEAGSGKAADTTDLLAYLDKAREKTAAFLKLYSNSSINSTLRGGGYCAYSTSARCDSYDDSADVKEAMDKGAIYNELRLGAGRTNRK